MHSVIEAIAGHAARRPDAPAFIAGGETLDYGELYRLVRGFAGQLKQMGLERGGRVAFQTEQSLPFVVALFGTHLAGGVFMPVDKSVSAPVLRSLCERAGAWGLISGLDAGWPVNIPYAQVMPLAESGSGLDGELTFPSPEEGAELLFTTGTTGASKGVLCSHRSMVGVAQNLNRGMEYHQDTLMLVPGQLSHANAFRKLPAAALMGSGAVILDGFTDLSAFFGALDSLPINALCLPTAAVRMILALSGDRLGRYKDRIEFVETGSAMLPEADKARMCELLPHSRLYNSYGTSEAGSSCMYDYNRERGLVNCIGYPAVNARFRVLNEQGEELAHSSKDNPGLIAYTGSMMMTGYWNDPELTRRTLHGGWVHTSDLGYMDEAGRVYVLGRKDDVINVGGKKVAPDEVEAAALTIEGIAECGCTRMADPMGGEAIRLLVVMKPGAAFEQNAIREALRQRLEDFKLPRRIERRDSLPRTPNGKLLRRELK